MKTTLSDPEKSKKLWHDLLKYTTIFRYYVDMIREEEFGKIPKNLQEPVMILGAVGAKASVFTRNLSLLSKIELKQFTLNVEQRDVFEDFKEALGRMQPVFEEKRFTYEIQNNKGPWLLKADQKNCPIFLENMIYTLVSIGDTPVQSVHVDFNSTTSTLSIYCSHHGLKGDVNLSELGDLNSLWDGNDRANDLSLSAYILKAISKKYGGHLSIESNEKQYLISYCDDKKK